MNETNKPILDAACGSRMFWWNRKNPDAIYLDKRSLETTLCDGRPLTVAPDVLADFKNIPYDDETFHLIVFDPPHLIRAGDNSWLALKYGKLPSDWENEIKQGFDELWRVLKKHGTLVMKWNEEQIKTKDVLKAIGRDPHFGDRRSKTRWMIFFKGGEE